MINSANIKFLLTTQIRIGFLAMLIAGFFVQCQEIKKVEKPGNLIPEEKMVDILTDCYINNAVRSIGYAELKDAKIKLDSMIYIKYAVDSAQFAQSNAYYSLQFNTYTRILDQVEQRLTKLKAQIDSLVPSKEKPQKKEKGQLFDPAGTDQVLDSLE